MRSIVCAALLAACWMPAARAQAPAAAQAAEAAPAVIVDSVEGGGHSGGTFFILTDIDGRTVERTALSASLQASRGRGMNLNVQTIERDVPSGQRRLRLAARVGFAAPIQSIFSSRTSREVQGEVNVTLAPNVRYRVTGVLDAFRREVWIEESDTHRRIGDKLVGGDRLPMPATTLYTCCNLRYEDDWVSDGNYLTQPIIPAGSRIVVNRLGRWVAYVLVDGREMRIGQDYNRKLVTTEAYHERLMLKDDPTARWADWAPLVRQAIEAGRAVKGMTREQVLVALGYPRADRNPSLEAARWVYTPNEEEDATVVFGEDGKVAAIEGSEWARSLAEFTPPAGAVAASH